MIPKSLGFRQTGKPSSRTGGAPGAHSLGPVGLVAGTMVWTSDGALPVEFLVAGDRVVTRDGGLTTLSDMVGHTALTRLIRLPAQALDAERPSHVLDLPAAQPVLVRGHLARRYCGAGAMFIAAQTLLDWRVGSDLGRQSVRLFTPVFDRSHILYCCGIEIGFFDPGT